MTTYYEDLGVAAGASQDDIKAAWRRKASQHHPDKGDSGDEAAFKRAKQAYECLSDSGRRAEYDATGRDREAGGMPTADDLARQYLEAMIERGIDATEHSLVKWLHDLTVKQRQGVAAEISSLKRRIAGLEKRRGRIKRKTAGIDLFDLVVQRTLQASRSKLTDAEMHLEILSKALTMIDDLDGSGDEPPADEAQGLRPLGSIMQEAIAQMERRHGDARRNAGWWTGTST